MGSEVKADRQYIGRTLARSESDVDADLVRPWWCYRECANSKPLVISYQHET